jgi:hypothetical protein
MSVNGSPEYFDQSSNSHGLRNIGFSPELYTVASGSYASNAVYGLGAALVNSYLSIQIPRGTTTVPLTGASGPPFVTSTNGCDVRQHDNEVDFVCSVVLNGTTDPGFGNNELRIHPQTITPDKPARYQRGMPLAKAGSQIIFDNVEIVNRAGVQIAPDSSAGAGKWLLQARLLKDGTIALVKSNVGTVGTQQLALRASDINAGFVANNVIIITVRGWYRAQYARRTGDTGSLHLYA